MSLPHAHALAVDLADVATGLAARMRAAGVMVGVERSGRFAAALAYAAPATTAQLYWVARVTLVGDHRELEAFDGVFASVFGGAAIDAVRNPDAPPPRVAVRAAEPAAASSAKEAATAAGREASVRHRRGEAADGEPGEARAGLGAVSARERLRSADFAQLSDAEVAELRLLLARLEVIGPARPARRRARHRGGDRLDLRATLARAARSAGEPVHPVRSRRRTRRRRVVLLCDVSGSMQPYARAYLQLLHTAVRRGNAEAFAFATRLTRLTRELALRTPVDAIERAGAAPPDWAGGTRIGSALGEFLDRHGRRGMARGAVVVIVSDGWEGEDPDLVGEQMARLARLAHRIVWVNPRRASPRYQPLVAGMAAALPHVDCFLSGHSLAALEEVAAAISAPAP